MKELQLRGKQPQAIDTLRQGVVCGKKRQVLYLPTGGGKTECAIYLMKCAMEKGKRSAMLMDRRVLVQQTSKRLEKYNIPHGVIMAGESYQDDKLIQICSEQTLKTRGGLNDIDLLILDECHNTRKSTIDLLSQYQHLTVIGLSASPFTKGLADIYHGVVSVTTTKELTDLNLLTPLKTFIAKEVNMDGAKKIAGEWSEKEATERAIQISGDVVKEWEKKTHEIFGKPRKTIVFSAGVKHGKDLEEKFNQSGYNFKLISYLDKEDTKKAIIEEFSNPDSEIIGLIATDILTKGFDCADVMIGVSARPFSKSFSSHVQQLGRVMRSSPETGKEFGVWICHSGNFLRFVEDWSDLYHNGVTSLDSKEDAPRKEKKKNEKDKNTCPVCSSFVESDADFCPICGWQRPRIEIKQSNAEIVEFSLDDINPPRIRNGAKVYDVKTISKPIEHISKAGNLCYKVVINNKFSKYFAMHTTRGIADYNRLQTRMPIEIEVKKIGNFEDVILIW